MRRLALILSLVLLSASLNAQQLYQEGFDYKKLEKPQPTEGDQIEVIEFFWYVCSHCYNFEPSINKWKKTRKPDDVKLTLIPAVFHKSQAVHAQAYYAAESMGVLDKVHPAIFDAIHRKKQAHKEAAHIGAIVDSVGVNRKKFLEEMASFGVDSKVRRAEQMARKFPLPGVPTIVINGRYIATGSMAQNYDRMLDIIDYLIGLERGRLKAEAKAK